MNGICLSCFDPATCAAAGICSQDLSDSCLDAVEGVYDDGVGILTGYGDYDEDDPWKHIDPPEW